MTELSPAAQAVLDATEEDGKTINGMPLLRPLIAAALREAAVQVVLPKYQYADWKMADLIMKEIHAIADELEAQ